MRRLFAAVAAALAVAGGPAALAQTGGPLGANPDPIDFGVRAVGDTPTIPVTIRNGGGATLTIRSVAVTGSAAFAKTSDGCGGGSVRLRPSGTCTVGVRFAAVSGHSTGTLTITDDDASTPSQSFAIQGDAVTHRFVVTAPANGTSFGSVAVGEASAGRTVTLTNQTTVPANPDLSLSDPTDFGLQNDTCGAAVSGSCHVDVVFAPGSIGAMSTVLQADGGAATFTGTGVDGLVVAPGALSFGRQRVGTVGTPQSIGVTNNRSSTVALNVSEAGPHPAEFALLPSGTCGAVLAAAASCSIDVAFSPADTGPRAATVRVNGLAVAVDGTGTAPGISVSTGSIGFGSQPVFTTSAPATITVTNTGTADLTVSDVVATGAGSPSFGVSEGCTAASPLPPNGQCSVQVQYTPTVVGPATAAVAITSDAGTGQETVDLSGTGTPSAVAFTPVTGEFIAPRAAGLVSPTKVITVQNLTSAPLSIDGVTIGGANPRSFRIVSGTCAGKTLAAGGTCTEGVRFVPNEPGAKAALLQVADNGPATPHTLALSGTAVYPLNDRALRATVGCSTSRVTWQPPAGSRYAGAVVVRRSTRVPLGPSDGSVRPHNGRTVRDVGLGHFTTYYYRVFARYRSLAVPGTFNVSRGVVLRVRTGEFCAPENGSRLADTTPTATWLPSPTRFGYALLLYHAGHQVGPALRSATASYHFSPAHPLTHGYAYTLFVYAYPPGATEGAYLGKVAFSVR